MTDVPGYYGAIGIDLPNKQGPQLQVRCFANPNAHKRNDRNASCSVNVDSGVWCCFGCGAQGGAYDAGLAMGLAKRDSMELLKRHGLVDDDRAAS